MEFSFEKKQERGHAQSGKLSLDQTENEDPFFEARRQHGLFNEEEETQHEISRKELPMPSEKFNADPGQNERLRKAILRNKSRIVSTHGEALQREVKNSNIPAPASVPAPAPAPASASASASASAPAPSLFSEGQPENSTRVPTRTRVARMDDDFLPEVKKPVSKKALDPNYSKKSKIQKNVNFYSYVVKAAWVFCVLLVLRLIFTQGGVIDFYHQVEVLNKKKLEFQQIKSENSALAKEIYKMRNDHLYQKKIVRDNLGFIAEDEYLVLFPKE